MKPLKLISAAVLVATLSSCNPQTEIKTLMESSDTRTEVFGAISGNDAYMKEFTDVIMNDSETRDMLGSDPKMMDYLINNDGMAKMFKANPEAEDHIMEMMLADTTMTKMMFTKAMENDANLLMMGEYLKNKNVLSKGCNDQLTSKIKAEREKSAKPAKK